MLNGRLRKFVEFTREGDISGSKRSSDSFTLHKYVHTHSKPPPQSVLK